MDIVHVQRQYLDTEQLPFRQNNSFLRQKTSNNFIHNNRSENQKNKDKFNVTLI